jgi:hypothetical protein
VAFHVEQAELEHGEQTDRPGADDQHISLCCLAHSLILENLSGGSCFRTGISGGKGDLTGTATCPLAVPAPAELSPVVRAPAR